MLQKYRMVVKETKLCWKYVKRIEQGTYDGVSRIRHESGQMVWKGNKVSDWWQ